MSRYFAIDCPYGPFKVFSMHHVIVLMTIIILCFLIYFFRTSLKKMRISTRLAFSIIILLLQVLMTLWYIFIMKLPLVDSLPLHLCDIASVLCAIMFINKSFRLYEVTYFWGLAGSTQAVLTPDIGIYTYPHFIFFEFFIVHGLVIIICLFMTFVDEYRPNLRSLIKSFIVLNLYTVFIGFYNYFAKTNYLFICQKPARASLMDYLGPWPLYIFSLEVVCLLSFLLCYIPFLFKHSSKESIGSRAL